MSTKHVDVLIVGAGLSGIGAAYHLTTKCPDKSYAILEGRDAIGGTWDLFRYPGIRSDSDMFTLGYNFKPWTDPKIIADGHSIREYVQATARENGIDKKIRFGRKVLSAGWSTKKAQWAVEALNKATGDHSSLPLRLPGGFVFESADVFPVGKSKVRHARYTDGLTVISLFLTDRPVRLPKGGIIAPGATHLPGPHDPPDRAKKRHSCDNSRPSLRAKLSQFATKIVTSCQVC